MSRFINQIPKVCIGEAGPSLGDRMHISYNKAAHSDDYMPDKWNIAWGRHAKELAQMVIGSQDGGVGQFFEKLWDRVSKSAGKGGTTESVNEADGAEVDFAHYVDLCSSVVSQLRKKSAEFVETLEKSNFWKYDFESRPKVEALFNILKDSFDPEKAEAGTDATPTDGGGGDASAEGGESPTTPEKPAGNEPSKDGKDGTEGVSTPTSETPNGATLPELQKSYQPRHVNKAKPKSYKDVYDMLGDFGANYDKKGAVTKRIVYAMFDEVNKMRKENGGKPVGDDKAKEVAQRALNSVGSGNAARAVV